MKRLAETRYSLKISDIFNDLSDLESEDKYKDMTMLNSLIRTRLTFSKSESDTSDSEEN